MVDAIRQIGVSEVTISSSLVYPLLPLQHSLMSNTYFKSDHFNGADHRWGMETGLKPKLEDPDSCYVRRHWDIHCKNVRRSNGIWAPCSGADDVADESNVSAVWY
jgi:hypothetical protein